MDAAQVPVEVLSLPVPLNQLVDLAAFPVQEGGAYVFFYDPSKFSRDAFYNLIVDNQIAIPFQLLFVPLIPGAEGVAIAGAAFEDIASWVDQVRADQ